MGGNTSFIFGDFYMPEQDNPRCELIGLALDGPLHINLPSGQKLKLGAKWLVYVPLSALGEAVEGAILQARVARRAAPTVARGFEGDPVLEGLVLPREIIDEDDDEVPF